MRRQARFILLLLCLVGLCEAVGSQQQLPTVNLRPRSVASEPGIPKVRVTVDQRRVPLGTRVTFSLTPASIVNDSRYVVTLYFGDGEKQLMTGPQTSYVYPDVGTYTYAVDVKPRQRCDARVALSVSASSVHEGEPVKFSAQPSGNCPNIQYRFVFGDGSSSNWQSSRDAQHSYAPAGKYLPYVDISDGKSRIGGSLRKRLDVTRPDGTPRGDVTVSLTAEPLSAQPGKPVTFTAKASPARPDARYQFSFGDGNRTSWQTDPQAKYTYKTRGIYRPYVQVSQFINNQNLSATSAPAVLRVRSAPPDPGPSPTPPPTPTPGPSPSPTAATSPTTSDSPTPSPGNGSPSPGSSPSGSDGTNVTGSETPSPSTSQSSSDDTSPGKTWLYLLIAAVILFLIYQASGFLFAAQPTFAPFADHGVAAVAHEKGALPIDFQLVLDPNVSGGDYSVTTDQPRLVTNAPETEERQIIEI
jgi:hypothetical protein